jgi:cell division septation protein DedD
MMRADIADTVASVAEPEATAPPTTGWFVQVVALRDEGAASDVAALLTRAKMDAVVVRDAGFFKVRAGPYPTRAEASRALPGIRRLAGGDPFVLQVN